MLLQVITTHLHVVTSNYNIYTCCYKKLQHISMLLQVITTYLHVVTSNYNMSPCCYK